MQNSSLCTLTPFICTLQIPQRNLKSKPPREPSDLGVCGRLIKACNGPNTDSDGTTHSLHSSDGIDAPALRRRPHSSVRCDPPRAQLQRDTTRPAPVTLVLHCSGSSTDERNIGAPTAMEGVLCCSAGGHRRAPHRIAGSTGERCIATPARGAWQQRVERVHGHGGGASLQRRECCNAA